MKLDKDDITAFMATVIINLIAFFFLYTGVLKTMGPSADSGIPVNFGEFVVAGIYQPSSGTPVLQQNQNPPQPQPAQTPPRQTQPQQRQTQPQQRQTQTQQRPTQTQPQQRQTQPRQTTTRPATQTTNERVITQDKVETAPAPENTNNNAAVAEANAQREKEEAAARQREAEQQKEQAAIDNRAASNFGTSGAQEKSSGDASSGISNAGSPFGNTSSRQTGGPVGTVNLGGRTLRDGFLPAPADTECETGRIVINITVDPNGNVISAEIGRGTNISNSNIRNSTVNAAKNAKFNREPISTNQIGTITYNYVCK